MPPRMVAPRALGSGKDREGHDVLDDARSMFRRVKGAGSDARQTWPATTIGAGATVRLKHRLEGTPWVILRPTGTDVQASATSAELVLTSAAGASVAVLAWVV